MRGGWVIAVLASSLLVGSIVAADAGGSGDRASDTAEIGDCRDPHPPIRIAGDAMFRLGPAVGVVNPEAAGTPEDPYVIEAWCITPLGLGEAEELPPVTPTRSAGIVVEGTDAHLVIRDTLVDGSPGESLLPVVGVNAGVQNRGIVLDSASNVTVASNQVINHFDAGVHVNASDRITLETNVVSGNGNDTSTGDGIRVEQSHELTVRSNELADNADDGIEVLGTGGPLVFAGNQARDNGGDGIDVDDADADVEVRENRLQRNGDEGLEVDHLVGDIVVEKNDVHANGEHGVEIEDVDGDVDVTANTLLTSDGEGDGVALGGVTGKARVVDNTAEGNDDDGIDVSSSPGAVVERNLVEANAGDGIYVASSPGAVVAENVVRLNDRTGVRVPDGTANVTGNSLTANDGHGVAIEAVDAANVTSNTIAANGRGVSVDRDVFFQSPSDVTLANNTIAANDFQGVRVFFASRTTLTANTITDHGDLGIEVFEAHDTEIHGNNIANNTGGGLEVQKTTTNATGNWWGASDGPSGGIEDACTGEVADGEGQAVILPSVGGICFDPWLASPNPDAGAD